MKYHIFALALAISTPTLAPAQECASIPPLDLLDGYAQERLGSHILGKAGAYRAKLETEFSEEALRSARVLFCTLEVIENEKHRSFMRRGFLTMLVSPSVTKFDQFTKNMKRVNVTLPDGEVEFLRLSIQVSADQRNIRRASTLADLAADDEVIERQKQTIQRLVEQISRLKAELAESRQRLAESRQRLAESRQRLAETKARIAKLDELLVVARSNLESIQQLSR